MRNKTRSLRRICVFANACIILASTEPYYYYHYGGINIINKESGMHSNILEPAVSVWLLAVDCCWLLLADC